MGLRFLVVLGSMREGRMGERVAKLLMTKLEESGHSPQLLDPLKIPNEGRLLQPLHFHRDKSAAPAWMHEINKQIQDCDGLLVVTAEYNCSLPPALTALLDNFPPASYRHKPAAIACYSLGSFGGFRAAALARPFLSELGMVTTPHQLVIPEISKKIAEDSTCSDERVLTSVDKLIGELSWYATALTAHIKTAGKPN